MATKVIGLTGAFGSGCSTAAEHLRDTRGFKLASLSKPIRDEWKSSGCGPGEPKRTDLQRLGNDLRMKYGAGVLVDRVLQLLGPLDAVNLLTIDGIRNVGEIERLRAVFGYEFTLLAVLSSSDARMERILSKAYISQGLTERDFHLDDARDKNEETEWGQQVEICIDRSDIFVDNADAVTLKKFKEQVLRHVDLATGSAVRPPTPDEINMNIAFGASHSSRCLKRHVGAVVVDRAGMAIVGTGYNENPLPTKPCMDEEAYGKQCKRDIIRNEHFMGLSEKKTRCPHCAAELPVIVGPPWSCPSCAKRGEKTNLEQFFFPGRAMNWCTAIHAEDRALRAAGRRARGGSLYSTTFPCMQCAEKITEAGIKRVCYTDVYPDPYSAERLVLANIAADRFQGVRSASFERIFASVKPK